MSVCPEDEGRQEGQAGVFLSFLFKDKAGVREGRDRKEGKGRQGAKEAGKVCGGRGRGKKGEGGRCGGGRQPACQFRV